jgi:hypothetical protein
MWGITPGSIRLNDALVVVHGAIAEDRTGSLFAFLYGVGRRTALLARAGIYNNIYI